MAKLLIFPLPWQLFCYIFLRCLSELCRLVESLQGSIAASTKQSSPASTASTPACVAFHITTRKPHVADQWRHEVGSKTIICQITHPSRQQHCLSEFSCGGFTTDLPRLAPKQPTIASYCTYDLQLPGLGIGTNAAQVRKTSRWGSLARKSTITSMMYASPHGKCWWGVRMDMTPHVCTAAVCHRFTVQEQPGYRNS